MVDTGIELRVDIWERLRVDLEIMVGTRVVIRVKYIRYTSTIFPIFNSNLIGPTYTPTSTLTNKPF